MDYDLESGPLAGIPWEKRVITLTAHRRENFGRPLENICQAVKEAAGLYDDIHFVYPVHLNPLVQEPAHRLLGDVEGVTLLEPLGYLPLVHLMKRSTLVLTDSGGIQEEAPGLGKPVLVLREKTERPEAVEQGTVNLVGTDKERILSELRTLLDDPSAYERMARAVNPYGDGKAAGRIVEILLKK
jgi:UDP-N-acetylglucosamine 2-epimerase (non-hydrolysing)